jgi:hypothetical protein
LKSRIRKQKNKHPFLLLVIFVFLFVVSFSSRSSAFEIVIKLTGNEEFPGVVRGDAGSGKKMGRVCLLGLEVKGSIDLDFIMTLSEQGIPEGDYQVSKAFTEEMWPTSSFSANGALRLVPQSESALEFPGQRIKIPGVKSQALFARCPQEFQRRFRLRHQP